MKFIYPGSIHIHTTYSDGTSDIKTVAKHAKRAGLAWIIVTDHNSLAGLHNDEEGFYDGVAVIVGNEISPDTSDHYLAFDVKKDFDPDLKPHEYIQEVKDQGGFGFIAHPDENIGRKNSFRPLRWSDWEIKGFDGIEIWNYASDWVDNYVPGYNALGKYLYRHHSLTGPTKNVLKWWDKVNLCNEQIVPALGGVDAHALIFRKGPFQIKFADYYDTFRTITNLIFLKEKLSEDFATAKQQILNAVKSGNNIICNRLWGKNKDYPIFYADNNHKKAYPGEKIKFDKYTKLVARIPQKGNLRLIYDGQLIWEYETDSLEFDKLDVGKYRIEVYYKNKPWIFSNHILICEDSQHAGNNRTI